MNKSNVHMEVATVPTRTTLTCKHQEILHIVFLDSVPETVVLLTSF